MRKTFIGWCGAAIAAGGAPSLASAAMVVTSERSAVDARYDRVVLYALNDVASDQLLNADIEVSTFGGNLVFPVVTVNDANELSIRRSVLQSVTTTRGALGVFWTLLGPTDPSHQGPDDLSDFPPLLYGAWRFSISGIDGRLEPTRGTDAGSSVNGGRGAAVFAAVVPKGLPVFWRGRIGAESGVSGTFGYTLGASPPPPTGGLAAPPPDPFDAPPPGQFGSGTLVDADPRLMLLTSGDGPTIYTLTADFTGTSDVSIPFELDTHISNGSWITRILSSPFRTGYGDSVLGTVQRSFAPITEVSLATPDDSATLRIVTIVPEPSVLPTVLSVASFATASRARRQA